MTVLSPSDYADTGQWRLLIKISPGQMTASLENTLHDDVAPFQLFEEKWDPTDDNLLKNIEKTVYDNPRVLDDFSAKIIIFDRKSLFIPEAAVKDEGEIENIYCSIYPAEENDIFTDSFNNIIVAFASGAGVRPFLMRTFPGARITCNLMDKIRNISDGKGRENKTKEFNGPILHIERREGESDYILTDSGKLISASTHVTGTDTDTIYHALNILDVYDFDPSDVTVDWKGIRRGKETDILMSKFKEEMTAAAGKSENSPEF